MAVLTIMTMMMPRASRITYTIQANNLLYLTHQPFAVDFNGHWNNAERYFMYNSGKAPRQRQMPFPQQDPRHLPLSSGLTYTLISTSTDRVKSQAMVLDNPVHVLKTQPHPTDVRGGGASCR